MNCIPTLKASSWWHMLVFALGRQGQEELWACLATQASLTVGFQSSEPLSQPKMMSEVWHLELTSGFHNKYMYTHIQHMCMHTNIHTHTRKKKIFPRRDLYVWATFPNNVLFVGGSSR